MRRLLRLVSCGVLVAAGLSVANGQEEEPRPEVTLCDREINRLDIFEDRALSVADAAFDQEEYAAARDKYGAFLEKHPDSPAASYAMLRKARCAELAGQPSEAAADYQALVSRFPKLAKYAAPALFHLGECHAADGATDKAIEVFSKLAGAADYRESPLAAEATQRLVALVGKEDDPSKVLEHYERLALDWRDSDDEVAQKAIKAITRQHVRAEPDEAKLREFYRKIEEDAGEKPETTVEYWVWVSRCVLDNGSFGYSQREAREKYYKYWLGVLEGKYPDSDDYQIAMARLQYGADRDRTKLAERLDAQFQKGQKEGDWRRVLKWVQAFKGNWTKTREYAAMLDFETAGIDGIAEAMDILCNEQKESYLAKSTFKKFAENVPFDKLTNDEIKKLISISQDTLEDGATARSLVEKLHFDKLEEPAKLALAREYLEVDVAIARQIYDQLEDQESAKLELFEHCVESGDTSEAISLAGELAEIEEYAEKFALKKAELLQAAKRYSEAIAAYRQCGSEPATLWRIVECHLALEQHEEAIEQLRAIATAHEDQAAKAVYRIAVLYGEAEEEEKQIATLREIVKKYPASDEADKAEQELGEMGIPPALPAPPSLDL